MATDNGVEIRIMGVPYVLKGRQDEKHLRAVAAFVDEQMSALAQKSRITSTPKLAVLTALNLAEEVLRLRQQEKRTAAAKVQLKKLEKKVTVLLQAEEES